MASTFPTSLDAFTNPTSGNTLDSPSHSQQHGDANDAVEALEAKLGVGSSTAGSATAGYALVNTSGGTTAYSLLGVTGLSSGTAVANTVLTANGSGAATFASLPTSASGLTLINTTSFSGVASQTFDSVFTTTYNTYLIDVIFTGSQSNTVVNMNLRSSAPTDLTATNVYRTQVTTLINTVSASQSVSNTVFPVSLVSASGDRQNNRITIVLSNLADAEFKHGYSLGNTQDGDGDAEGTLRFFNFAGTTASAGLKLAISAGTFSGVGRIYGYSK